MKHIRLTLSSTQVELGEDGKWRYRVLKREEWDDDSQKSKTRTGYPWLDRVAELRAEGKTFAECADILAREGYRGYKGKPRGQSSIITMWHYHTRRK